MELKVRKDKAMNENKFQQLYLELEKIIQPQLLHDFCGYNVDVQAFDIVLAVKEILADKDEKIEAYKQEAKKTSTELKAEIDRCRRGWSESEIKKIWYQQEEQTTQEKYFDLKIQLNKYRRALNEIQDISNAAVNGVHFVNNSEDLICHLQELSKQIVSIITKVKDYK